MIFFMIQLFGIVIGDLAIRAYQRYPIRTRNRNRSDQKEKRVERWRTLLRYCWVLAWITLSGNILVDAYLKTEMGLVGPSPIISTELFGLTSEKGMYTRDDFDVALRIWDKKGSELEGRNWEVHTGVNWIGERGKERTFWEVPHLEQLDDPKLEGAKKKFIASLKFEKVFHFPFG